MVYLKLYPRPMGPEPKLYFERPAEGPPEVVEVEPGYFLEDPFSGFDIIEFESEFLARRWLKENYPMTYAELRDYKKTSKLGPWNFDPV